jgi:hypothetical protein
MSRPSRGAILSAAVILVFAVVFAESAGARGGGRGGGGRVGGGLSRGTGGFRRGGPAARGSFGQERLERELRRDEWDVRGPAADGSFEAQYRDQAERQERREERRERWDDNGEDWPEYVEGDDEDYGGYYYEDDYDEAGAVTYWELPCKPNIIAMGGATYYTCGATWYIRAYSDGELVYTVVPPPGGN